MRRGRNVWENAVTGEMGKSETRPGKGEAMLEWYPAYPASRVSGHTYQPYGESTEWERMANRAMAEAAKANFQRRS